MRIFLLAFIAAWAAVPAMVRGYFVVTVVPARRALVEGGVWFLLAPLWILAGLAIWAVGTLRQGSPSERLMPVLLGSSVGALLFVAVDLAPPTWGSDRAIARAFESYDREEAPRTLAEYRDGDFRPGAFVQEVRPSEDGVPRVLIDGLNTAPLPAGGGELRIGAGFGVPEVLVARPVREGWWFIYQESR